MRLLLLVLALLPAAGETRIPLEPLPNAKVGRVDGTRAFIAISRAHGRLRVYVCDGTPKRDPTVSVWFRGRAGARKLRADGHTLTLGRDGGHGTFDGHRFTARRAKEPAGLFRGRAAGLTATWIVRPDRQRRGAMIPTRPPRCRVVLVAAPDGTAQWVTVCG